MQHRKFCGVNRLPRGGEGVQGDMAHVDVNPSYEIEVAIFGAAKKDYMF